LLAVGLFALACSDDTVGGALLDAAQTVDLNVPVDLGPARDRTTDMAVTPADPGLGIFAKNPNYLTYKGKPLFLFTPIHPKGYQGWTVKTFPLGYFKELKASGGNHLWLIVENTIRTPWSEAKNSPQTFYDKLGQIAKRAHANDVILGIAIFGFSVKHTRITHLSSFNKQCTTDCGGDPGPLNKGDGFFDTTSTAKHIVEARAAQQNILTRVAKATWKYPNVYYSLMWEINVIWNKKTDAWVRWARKQLQEGGKLVSPQTKHLIALEKTITPSEAKALQVDFVVDEDGNAFKRPGLPLVYWSLDGVFRDKAHPKHSCWNKSCEPTLELSSMRKALIQGAAGTATVWATDPEEKKLMQRLSTFAKTVSNWCDEPGQELTEATVPKTHADPGKDRPPGKACTDK